MHLLSASRSTPVVRRAPGLALALALAGRAATAEPQHSPAVAPEPAAVAVVQLLAEPEIRDGIAPQQRARMKAAVAAYRARYPGRGKTHGQFLYHFFPQAGALGRDLFLENFADMNPAPGLIRDWDCSNFTYDGHQGHDSRIRSFREQAIGVPVFAAHDGVVIASENDQPDMNIDPDFGTHDNYALIDHGGGYEVWYSHLKRGSVSVTPGQVVVAGQQIGLTASSGPSNWPHLHLETQRNGTWVEPSAGPCRTGDSLWAVQPPVVRDMYVSNFYLSRDSLSADRTAVMLDQSTRTASLVKGTQRVDARVDVHNLVTRALYRLRVVSPGGQVALEQEGEYENQSHIPTSVSLFSLSLDLSTVGTWRFQLDLEGNRVLDVPFRVVAKAAQAKNRAPSKIGVVLAPSPPRAGEVVACEVQTSMVGDDPDYDLVRYRYEWREGSKLLRSLTSAASTDLLAANLVKAGKLLSCRVTPNDGQRAGPSAKVAKKVVGGG